jgi:hypothetical protein
LFFALLASWRDENQESDESHLAQRRKGRQDQTKVETRNSKQIQMINNHKIPNNLVSDFELRNSDFNRGRLGAKNFVEVVLLNILSVRI